MPKNLRGKDIGKTLAKKKNTKEMGNKYRKSDFVIFIFFLTYLIFSLKDSRILARDLQYDSEGLNSLLKSDTVLLWFVY